MKTLIIELNLTYHFENMIDLKIYSTEIIIALLSPQTIEKVLPSTCFADIRLLDQIGRQGYCLCICSMYVIFPSGAINYFSVSNISEYEPESIMCNSEMTNKFLASSLISSSVFSLVNKVLFTVNNYSHSLVTL